GPPSSGSCWAPSGWSSAACTAPTPRAASAPATGSPAPSSRWCSAWSPPPSPGSRWPGSRPAAAGDPIIAAITPQTTEGSMARWRNRPEGSTWGDFGPDDHLGRLNLIGPEQVRKGVAEVRDGVTFCLSLPLTLPGRAVVNPNRLPPVLRPALRSGAIGFNCNMSVAIPGASDVMCDDLVVLHTQYSTQWDAFGHAGSHFDADGDGTPERV